MSQKTYYVNVFMQNNDKIKENLEIKKPTDRWLADAMC